jgi:membrane protein required for colicin V production
MTWVDGVVLAVLALSAVIAFFRGMVREVLSVGAWVGAAALALVLRHDIAGLLGTAFDPPWIAEALAAAGTFLVLLIVLKLLTGAIANRVQESILGDVDRALGLVFGLARGAALTIIAYILGGMLLPAGGQWPQPVRDARLLPIVDGGARWLVAQLPDGVQPRIAVPPRQPEPTQDDLMRQPARNRT